MYNALSSIPSLPFHIMCVIFNTQTGVFVNPQAVFVYLQPHPLEVLITHSLHSVSRMRWQQESSNIDSSSQWLNTKHANL